jgi:hypothetical protein
MSAMILQNEYWFDIIPSRGESNTIEGKWLHFGPTEQLHSWLDRLNKLVEDGELSAVKVARKMPATDPFPNKPCVLCAFTAGTEVSKKHAQEVLKNAFQINVSVWKSDEQTRQDWLPGGWLQVEADINHTLTRLKREGLTQTDKLLLRELAQHLRNSVDEIRDPTRVAEVELGRTRSLADELSDDLGFRNSPLRRTRSLANELSDDLGFRDSPLPIILARLEEIQNTLRTVSAQGQGSASQFAALATVVSSDTVFVIMPFDEKHLDTYDTIRRAVKNSGENFSVERIDERPGAIQINDETRKAIRTAGLIICDLTEERPNVYYELGFAHGLDKPIICIAHEGTTTHFDVYGIKILFFNSYRILEEKLAKEVRLLKGVS